MGPNLGGNLFQKMGLVEAYTMEDKGRGEVTNVATDNYFFKVPALRIIVETGPYMHDGSIDNLEEIVRIMAKHQLGKTVTEQQVADIVAFMNVLTGKVKTDYIAEPKLPGMS